MIIIISKTDLLYVYMQKAYLFDYNKCIFLFSDYMLLTFEKRNVN
jgi:hypothetical protein